MATERWGGKSQRRERWGWFPHSAYKLLPNLWPTSELWTYRHVLHNPANAGGKNPHKLFHRPCALAREAELEFQPRWMNCPLNKSHSPQNQYSSENTTESSLYNVPFTMSKIRFKIIQNKKQENSRPCMKIGPETTQMWKLKYKDLNSATVIMLS